MSLSRLVKTIFVLGSSIVFMGCLPGGDDDSNSGGSAGASFSVTVACTSTDNANCVTGSTGSNTYFAVVSSCSDLMTNGSTLYTTDGYNALSCQADVCGATSAGLPWQDDSTGAPLTTAPSGSIGLAAWIDIGSDSTGEPGVGDVLCCEEGVSLASGSATFTGTCTTVTP